MPSLIPDWPGERGSLALAPRGGSRACAMAILAMLEHGRDARGT
jgi:hypothetical protein